MTAAPLQLESIQAALQTEFLARDCRVVAVTGSTNADLLQAAKEGAREGATICADHQTSGRGREETGTGPRKWESPPGLNLYTSVLLRPPFHAGPITILVLAAGLATADTVAEYTGVRPRLKWPNDVLISGKKAAGILCQSARGAVVVGIGLNVNAQTDDFDGVREIATSMAMEAGRKFDRNLVACSLYLHLERWYKTFLYDPESVISSWCDRADMTGRLVRVQLPDGTMLKFRVKGVTPEGFLFGTDKHGKLHSLQAGDVLEIYE